MYKYLVFLLILFSKSLFSQNKPSILVDKKLTVTTSLYKDLNKNKSYLATPKINSKHKNFMVFDKNLNIINSYYKQNDKLEFIGFSTNPLNNMQGIIKDSYNPHGTSRMEGAIFSGIFDLLTKK